MRKTILLVEDESTTAFLETAILENYGFDVICVDTGEAAIEKISSALQIDMVLMDINLGSGIDGTRAAETILNIRELPLIFLSSHTEREVVEKTEGITSYGYIVKNTGETVLIAGVKMAFRLFEARKKEKEKEEALRAEKDFNQTLVQRSSAFFVAIKEDGSVIMMNESMLKALGYRASEVIGKNYISTFVPEEDRETLRDVFKKVTGNTHVIMNENRILARNGRVLLCEWHAIPILRANKFDFFLGVGTDITERRQAELKLEQQAADLAKAYEMQQMIFNQTFQFMGILDTAGHLLKVNRTALDFAGVTEDRVLGLAFWETQWWKHDPAQMQMVREAVKKAAAGETVRLETTHHDINGQLRNIDFSLKPIKNAAGEVIYLIPEGRDITEQKRTETELLEHRTFRSKMFESFKLPIVLMDSTTFKYLDCNPAAVSAYGFSSVKDVIGKTPLEFSAQFQYDGTPSAEKAHYYIQRAITEGAATFQWLHQRPDGSLWDAEVHLMYFRLNKISFLQFILIDVTHKKRQ
ncbi:MAG TPA: PAS domain S-box protein [Candidatus Wallbacteria bacterium]|nr:PAS domain S-box protein [Candidatus Wallbacteria bacterium]